ncbi:division/cell wall cluster transcriptional repressor MraZ [Saccharibacter sp. 17.LH.SD]|uniref:division/cell wall cluster transcriptional repressor MraZ n=1 Tax=Saccharibacter sp. 17.LH.SD TaxID=2689393 RepID=UPI00137186E7|nr:division/cell wall cluster transcriptional repressor MraZ [Saccharibacter sp. 17.LH.SD]MXV44662.1 division/cell wall cluster transcriptional repressor MraZ [Saccharibacter sp. 17.LH.SD]
MSMFLGTYPSRLDSKGRVSIPASFRAALKQTSSSDEVSLVLRPSHLHACIDGWGMAAFEALESALTRYDPLSSDYEDLATSLYADAYPLMCDKDGRVSLPKILKQHAALTSDVIFMGLGKAFQIWDPEAAEKRRQKARQQAQQLVQPRTPAPSSSTQEERS